VIVSSSSRGPAEDGRIKPDIAAHGQGQGSTDENDSYMSFGGTSAASPGIAGICAQMYDAYRSLNSNNDPESALIKAALLNTADDMGNPGPDFEYGWGRVNARRAVELIENNNYLSSTITNSTTNTHNLTIPSNVKEVRVMLYWSDYEATTSAAKDLVNDLDFEVVRPNNQTVLPWVLDPSPNVSALNSPAVRGVDDLNNMEQVTIENPPAGTYTLRVIGSAVPQGPQKYYIVHEFVYDEIIVTYPQGGEGFAPGETVTVRWDAYGRSNGQFSLQYSSNNGGSWSTFASSVHDTLRTYDWSIPNGAPVSGEYLLRVSRGGAVSGQSIENFSVIDIPNNIQITKVCPASTEISWNAVNSATSYDVYLLGQKYMDSVGTTTGTTFTIQGTNHTIDDWISVSANGPNGANGRRAVAVKKSPGVVNCVINTDAEISAISSPAGSYSDCFNTNNLDVSILITNNGSSAISNFDVVYQLDNNPVVRETVSSNIAVNGNAGYTFTADVSFPSVGTYDLKVWPELAGDQNPYNDTIHLTVTVLNSTLVTLPYSEDFESFSSCGTNSDCEAGVCNLSGGWTNLTNGQDDDIDWRTDNGGTPSNNTGPSVDHAPGTVQGNYLYTEASFGQTGCINKTAEMLSPCIDLTSTVNPVMVFYYHMDGQFMGELHVDAFDGTNWFNDIMLPITGDQGDQWFSATANLSQFNGKKIVLRFRGITGSSFTSDLAIDDVNIVDNAPPTAAFSVDKTSVCTNELITVTDASTGSSLNYTWNFGSGSNPSSSTSPGPHTFFYTFPGNKSITLQVTNVAGTDFATESISVTDIPASFFNFNQNNNVISFTNSSSGANSYFWDFGDGNTSTQNAPTHTYSALGTYTVRLISTNGCGSDTSTRSVTIDKLTSLEDITGVEVKLYPNPTSDNAYVDFGRTLNGEAVIRVTDASGKLVLEQIVNDVAGSDLNVSDFAAGIYQVEIRYEEESSVIPLRKQ
jgi:PKD repeat protein